MMPIVTPSSAVVSVLPENRHYILDPTHLKPVAEYRSVTEAAEDSDASDYTVDLVKAHFSSNSHAILVVINPQLVHEAWTKDV